MQKLQNKIAVITGGNSGIGKGIAKRFHQEGARVVLFGRKVETLAVAKRDIGENILIVQGDVTVTQDLHHLFQQTNEHFGKIDILVANAGVSETLPFEQASEEKFDYMVDINYRGLFFTVKYALEYLNHNSSIILISSCAAHMTVKNHSIYSSTKAAVSKLAQNLSYELANKGIRVNSISPGYIETPIFTDILANDPDYLKKREAVIPLKRIGTPDDIAKAASFLGSEDASYITGSDLLVDGGYSTFFPLIK